MAYVVIVGVGISGATTAYMPLQLGYQITVLDHHLYPATGTLSTSGGQLSISNAKVQSSTGTLFKGIKRMLRNDVSLLLSPKPSWHKYSWIGEFVASIAHYRRSTIETTHMAIKVRKHLFVIAKREQIDFDPQKRSILHVYYGKISLTAVDKTSTLLIISGPERHVVSPEGIVAIKPTLRGSYCGDCLTASDTIGDIHKFTRGLVQACEKRDVRLMHDMGVYNVEIIESGVHLLL